VTVLGMVAKMERKFIRERQQAGIEAATAKGVYKGREPFVPVERVREMWAAGQGPGRFGSGDLRCTRADSFWDGDSSGGADVGER
jgi:DNA invertase Pin-like site-specific DNA recombinase